MSQEFDVICLGGGVAGEAIAVGLQGSGLTLAVVERELVGGTPPTSLRGSAGELLMRRPMKQSGTLKMPSPHTRNAANAARRRPPAGAVACLGQFAESQ